MNGGDARRLAAAKINLWLHVGPRRADGYHPIHSLMVFADFGDQLTLREGRDAPTRVSGPFATALGHDNLIDRARAMLAEAYPDRVKGFTLELDKRLPVAAGLGGGSADAAAALRLIRDALALPATDADLASFAARLGSDVPACLASRPVIAEGRGERLWPAAAMPAVSAVLVNPGVPVSTAEVFRIFDQACPAGELDPPPPPPALAGVGDLADYLAAATRNDLQPAAMTIRPEIGEALSRLSTAPETLLARMSGSGATVFALTVDPASAARLAERLASARSDWWVRACVLAGR